jgi:anti-anti-sigma factor
MAESQAKHISCPLVVLRLQAERVVGDTLADALRDELLAIYTRSEAVHAIVDFQVVRYLSSAGFRPLLSLLREVHIRGGRLILCNLLPVVEEAFLVTRLINTAGPSTFEVQPNLAAAAASLEPKAPTAGTPV